MVRKYTLREKIVAILMEIVKAMLFGLRKYLQKK
jgi:hypothetical protein